MIRVTGRMADAQGMADNHALSSVTKAYTLSATDTVVRVEIPLAAADNYDVILPPVGAVPGTKLYMEFHRADGIYVNGAVTVKGAGDEVGTSYASLPVSDDGAFLVLENLAGRRWVRAAIDDSLIPTDPGDPEAEDPRVVTEAATLSVENVYATVEIPLAAVDSYDLTLPPVVDARDARYYIEFSRTAGSYVDGAVTVKSQADEDGDPYVSQAVYGDGDWLVLDNVAGVAWKEVASSLTPPVATADTPKAVTEAVTLGVAETCVHVTIPAGTADSYAITLPPVDEANGRIYSFEFEQADEYTDGAVTVTSQDDDLGQYEDASITKDGGFLVLLNVAGARWLKLDGDLSA